MPQEQADEDGAPDKSDGAPVGTGWCRREHVLSAVTDLANGESVSRGGRQTQIRYKGKIADKATANGLHTP